MMKKKPSASTPRTFVAARSVSFLRKPIASKTVMTCIFSRGAMLSAPSRRSLAAAALMASLALGGCQNPLSRRAVPPCDRQRRHGDA